MRSRRVGGATFFRLLNEYGSAQAALEALPHVARNAGAKDYTPCAFETALTEHRRGYLAGAKMISWNSKAYPKLLSQIPDPPPFFWAIGDAEILHRPLIALIGARNASSIGMRMARQLAHDLSDAGFGIVSGLARGIDTIAHEVALERGTTAAVLAGGVDTIYPKENGKLTKSIAEKGVLLSEQPPGLSPQARHFPRRNRLISGLSIAVVVVEAAAKSGSLITARDALDQGRDVLAVPGHPFDARAHGCNFLIRDGATLVRNAQDVIEAIGPLSNTQAEQDLCPPLQNTNKNVTTSQDQSRGQPAPPIPANHLHSKADLATLHSKILSRLGPSPLAEDQLIRDITKETGAGSADILPELVSLELDGHITRQPGGLLAKPN